MNKTGIGKITKQNNDGTVEVKEYSAPELFKALVQEQEVNDRNAQIACDTIAELSKDKERLTAELSRQPAREKDLVEALRSIANNTCCDKCQEAARVAQKAIAPYFAPYKKT